MIFADYFFVAYLAFKCTGPIMPSNNGSNLLSPLKKVNSGSSKRLEMPNQLFDAEKKTRLEMQFLLITYKRVSQYHENFLAT